MANIYNVSSADSKLFSSLTIPAAVWKFDSSNTDRLSQLPDILIKQILSGLEIRELPSLATSRQLSKMVRTEVADRITKFIKNDTSLFPKAEKTDAFTEFETDLRARLKAFQEQYEKAIKAHQGKSLYEKALKAMGVKNSRGKNPDDCLTIFNLSRITSEILDKKIEQTQTIEDLFNPSTVFLDIVQTLIAIRDLKRAEKVANTIQNGFLKLRALSDIVSAHVKAKDLKKAEEVANTIPDGFHNKSYAFVEIGKAYIEAKDLKKAEEFLKKAEEVANTILDKYEKSYVFVEIGRAYVEAKDLKKAEEFLKKAEGVANTIWDESLKSCAFMFIVRGYVKANDLSKAEKVANTMLDGLLKSEALSVIESAKEQIKMNKSRNGKGKSQN